MSDNIGWQLPTGKSKTKTMFGRSTPTLLLG